MDKKIMQGERCGSVTACPSKSHVQRLLICAALGQKKSRIMCDSVSEDISAAARVLNAVCADISYNNGIFTVIPNKKDKPDVAEVSCGESGAVLRFMMPICGALGKSMTLKTEGSLSKRPIEPFVSLLKAHGMSIEIKENGITVSGKLIGGDFSLPGDVSSQFVSGLLFALPMLSDDSTLAVTGEVCSSPYIDMTCKAITDSGISLKKENGIYHIPAGQGYCPPETSFAEGDWSSAANFLTMGAVSSEGVTVKGVSESSLQGDRAFIDCIRSFGADVTVSEDHVTVKKGRLKGIKYDASLTPDIVPAMAVLACAAEGTTEITGIKRLRFKESDRINSIANIINSLGGCVDAGENSLKIKGTGALSGGTVDSFGDHRIAMAASAAACICRLPVTVKDAGCCGKSFKDYWDVFDSLEVH